MARAEAPREGERMAEGQQAETLRQLQRQLAQEQARLAHLKRLMVAEGLLEDAALQLDPEPEPEPEPAPAPEPERLYAKKDALVARRRAKEAGVGDGQILQANVAMAQGDWRVAVTQLVAARQSILRQEQEKMAKKAALAARKKAKKAGAGCVPSASCHWHTHSHGCVCVRARVLVCAMPPEQVWVMTCFVRHQR